MEPNPGAVFWPNEKGAAEVIPNGVVVAGFAPNKLVDGVVVVVPKLKPDDEAAPVPKPVVPGVMPNPVWPVPKVRPVKTVGLVCPAVLTWAPKPGVAVAPKPVVCPNGLAPNAPVVYGTIKIKRDTRCELMKCA